MHVEKLKSSQVGSLLMHDIRSIENHTNEDIDPTRSHLNYNLVDGEPYTMFRQRLDQLAFVKKKSTNVLCSWAVTCPKDLLTDEDLQKQFFQENFDFLAKRYGRQNVVSAIVHMDETTPHMHFKFIPAIKDKDGIERLNAKAVINRTELLKIHKEAEQHMNKVFGMDGLILNGATANGNKTITELKLASLKEKEEQLGKEVNTIEAQLDTLKEAAKDFAHKKTITLKNPEVIEKGFLHKKESFVRKSDYDALEHAFKQTDKERVALQNANQALEMLNTSLDAQSKRLRGEIRNLKEKDFVTENKVLRALNSDLREENQLLKVNEEKLTSQLEETQDALENVQSAVRWYEGFYQSFLNFLLQITPDVVKQAFRFFPKDEVDIVQHDLDIERKKSMLERIRDKGTSTEREEDYVPQRSRGMSL